MEVGWAEGLECAWGLGRSPDGRGVLAKDGQTMRAGGDVEEEGDFANNKDAGIDADSTGATGTGAQGKRACRRTLWQRKTICHRRSAIETAVHTTLEKGTP